MYGFYQKKYLYQKLNLYFTGLVFIIMLGIFGLAKNSEAAILYVDNGAIEIGATWNGTDGQPYTGGSPGTGTGYSTIQAAVNACNVGDTIYMRGGTYAEHNIVIPNDINGPQWTTLSSYPGEWAILNGGGVQDAAITHAAGFGEYQKRNLTNQTSYWKFERFEVTGYAAAFWFSGGPQWYRYLYIHDITSETALSGGIYVTLPHDCIVEYCYFYNNNQIADLDNPQFGHIVFGADYRDDELPTTFDPNVCEKLNTIRYNYFNTSRWAIHYKNQQRFGTDARTAADVATNYGTWGDKIHHNISVNNTRNPFLIDQDNAQVFNNIINGGQFGGIQFGQEIQLSSDNCMPLNCIAYNNTVLNLDKSFGGNAGPDPTASHPYIYFYNNISQGNTSGDSQGRPFTIAADMTTGYYADFSNTYIKNNLIHSNAASTDMLRGRAQYYTLAQAESSFPTISGNWSNSTSGLFAGASGANQYKTAGSFSLDGSHTIADGGIGGNHPYLSGVTIPNYVGATNPDDNQWVDDVMSFATMTDGVPVNLKSGMTVDLDDGTPAEEDTTPPNAPSGLSVS